MTDSSNDSIILLKIQSFYFLLRASGVAMMRSIEVKEGKQTWLISGNSLGAGIGTLDIDIEQP